MGDGRVLSPLPIPRFRCPEHGVVPWLPWFLCRFIRYFARFVDHILTRHAETKAPAEELLVLIEPAEVEERTVQRWLDALLTGPVLSWLSEKLLSVASMATSDSPTTTDTAKAAIQAARLLARLHAPNSEAISFSPNLQLARLGTR